MKSKILTRFLNANNRRIKTFLKRNYLKNVQNTFKKNDKQYITNYITCIEPHFSIKI